MLKLAILVAIFSALASTAGAEEASLTIKNNTLEATYHPASNTLSIKDLKSDKTFIPSGKLTGTNGKARVTKVKDPIFGQSRAIEVTYADGNTDTIIVYPKLPFVLLRKSIKNNGSDDMVLSRMETLTATVDFGKPASELSILGTGGRKRGTDAVGSYEWIAIAQPKTRTGVVAGWITQERASGIVFSKENEGKIQLTARTDFGTMRIHPGKTEVLETLAIGYFEDARVGLETWADTVAKTHDIKLPPIPVGYCTWYHARASNEKDLIRDAGIAAEKLKPFGLTFMQIDDGWQDGDSKNGPDKNFTRVKPNGPYPNGMKPAADALVAKGITAGIWFMPFSGNDDDPWYADKQDWFYKTKDGKPFSAHWSGTLIDMTNLDAQKYLRDEVKQIKDWGYSYFKLDGLHSGTGTKQTYANMFYTEDNFPESFNKNPEKTNIEAHRGGLKLIREVAGKDVFILGCAAPQNMRSYGASFGLVDAMRIGPDNHNNWDGWLRSPFTSTPQYFQNGRIWYNDPDPVYVHTGIPTDQARAMCSWQAITGSLTVFSDSMAKLPDDRIDLLRRIMPTHSATARPVDLFENDHPRIWLVSDTKSNPRRDVIGLFNWTDKPSTFEYDMNYIGLSPDTSYVAYDYWNNELLHIKGKLNTDLQPTSCKILAIRPLLDRPMLLSTNRHVTQGIVDVIEEKWDAKTKTLSGRSRVVANDPYELRIVAISPKSEWKATSVNVSKADQGSGIKITSTPITSDGLVKVTINSPVSKEVSWTVKFN